MDLFNNTIYPKIKSLIILLGIHQFLYISCAEGIIPTVKVKKEEYKLSEVTIKEFDFIN